MPVFGIFLVIIISFLILKFIYDSYLTNNTEKEWQRYKSDFPEKARKIEGVEEPRIVISDKEQSMQRLAKNYGCEVWEVKSRYLEELKSIDLKNLSLGQFNELFSDQIKKESKLLGISPEDTASFTMKEWAQEVYLIETQSSTELEDTSEREKVKSWLNENGGTYSSFFKFHPQIFEKVVENFEFDSDFVADPDFVARIFQWIFCVNHQGLSDDEFLVGKEEVSEDSLEKLIDIAFYYAVSQFTIGQLYESKASFLIDQYGNSLNLDFLQKANVLLDKGLGVLDHEEETNFDILVKLYSRKAYVLEQRKGNWEESLRSNLISMEFEEKLVKMREKKRWFTSDSDPDELPIMDI
jgi:hypothetical protein